MTGRSPRSKLDVLVSPIQAEALQHDSARVSSRVSLDQTISVLYSPYFFERDIFKGKDWHDILVNYY